MKNLNLNTMRQELVKITTKVLFLSFVCLFFCNSHEMKAQTEVKQKKNTFAITPRLPLFFPDADEAFVFYQRSIKENGKWKTSLRLGLAMSRSFNHEKEINSVADRERNRRVNLGLEFERKQGKFSLYFGPELGHQRLRADNVVLSSQRISLFQPSAFFRTTDTNLDYSRFRMNSLHMFCGIRYYPVPQFSMGIEASAGIGFFSITSQQSRQRDPRVLEKGNIRGMEATRFFILAYHF